MKRTKNIIIRVTEDEKKILKDKSEHFNFESLSSYLRYVGLNATKIELDFDRK